MDLTRTFETRIKISEQEDEILCESAALFAHVKHRLFAEIASGKTSAELKNTYLTRYKITARHFNALRVQVEGKISSIKALRPSQILEKKKRIESLSIKIKKLIKAKADPQVIHQKKRRLHEQEKKLLKLQEDHEKGKIHLCFGSRKLFHAQFNLEKNTTTSHEDWLKNWQEARARELFFLGSKDEASGNQTCTATLQPNGALKLRIRLPDALFEKHGKYLIIPDVNFSYGKQEILATLTNPIKTAISWRLLHDKKGWRAFATFNVSPKPCSSLKEAGVVGIDINADHLALVETDRCGNPISKKVIPFNLYGKSSHQAKAVIGDVAKAAVAYAESTRKPLICEDLDFQKKKTELREKNYGPYARMLSSFAYSSLLTHLKSRSAKQGVLFQQVNPAYTSLIGRIKFAYRYGLSIHQSAALSIGRRYLRYSEKVPLCLSQIPDGKDGHVTLSLPVRKRHKHVWSLWSELSKNLQTALAAHFRTAKSRSKSSLKPAPETGKLSRIAGEIPAREPLEQLLV